MEEWFYLTWPCLFRYASIRKSKNILINANVSQAEYIKTRNKRDHGKAVPRLLLPSIQINLRAGDLGETESNGISYVKIPLNKI